MLAIKADLVSVEVHDEEDLKNSLQLPRLPSELISKVAKIRPVYVLIDQLDALASQLDLKSDRLNVLLNLVRRVGGLPNVHVLLGAQQEGPTVTQLELGDLQLYALTTNPGDILAPVELERFARRK